MIIALLRCNMCGHEFELEILDDDDPKERYVRHNPVRCPNPRCRSAEITIVRKKARALARR